MKVGRLTGNVREFLKPLTLGFMVSMLPSTPLFAEVESDIVGYTTIETIAGNTMSGVVFQGLDDLQGSASLNNLLSGDFQPGDQILVRNSTSGLYQYYEYASGRWYFERQDADLFPLKVGDAFWISTPQKAISVTIKGTIAQGDYRYVATTGYQMVSVGLPIDVTLNSAQVKWQGFQNGDTIQVLPKGSSTYLYYEFANGGWYKNRELTTDAIPVGSSFWITTQQAGAEMIVVNPVK